MNVKDRMLEMSRAVEESRQTYMLMAEVHAAAARDAKTKFDAYVSAGFSEEQALRLCCADRMRPTP